jgi:stearoyl-CoA desaturase (delta-9 desaturase)
VQTIAPPTNSPPIPASPPLDDPIVELPSPGRRRAQQFLTGVIVFGPLVAVAWVVAAALGGHLVALPTLAVAAAFYLFTVLGVTVGFHRLFTHRSFVARRPLKIALAVAGSMSFQGSVIGWVATHRRHHMYSDRAGDPHSPVVPEHHPFGRTRGFFHAHMGWFFAHEDTPRHRFAPDLLADRDLVWVDRLFVPLCIATLALPFGIGYALTGTLGGALSVLLWAGVLRVAFLHQITWSTNSVCHVFGRRPFRSGDRSTNFAPLALLSMGESWHNAHHAFPSLARHGVDRHQVDLSAMLIRRFEQIGWATRVRWPDAARLDARRLVTPPAWS